MDRLAAMSILLLTVEKGSLTAAAKALGMPLPTLSRRIGELEAHLGTRLLIRTTRNLAVTDAGHAYIAAARRILEDVDSAERAAAGEFTAPRGELVLTAPVLFGRLHILPVVVAFLAEFPDIDIRLILSDRNLHLIDDHVDMAVRIGVLPDSTMVATGIGTMRTIVCASPGWLAAHGAPASPADLAMLPCVRFAATGWMFRQAARITETAIRPRLSVTTAEAAVWAAAQGVGATRVLHYQCADALRDGTLRIILAAFELDPLPINLIHAARGVLPLKMRVFLDFATARLRPALRSLI